MKIFKDVLAPTIVFVLLIAAASLGAIADRLFVIKPLDAVFPRGATTVIGGSSEITQRVLQEESAVIEVTENVADSVVTVSIRQDRAVRSPFFMDPFGSFGQRQFEGRTETIEQDIGSGFVVEGGLVVTNRHVVGNPNAEYKVIDKNGEEYLVSNIYRDPVNDLAILQIEGGDVLSPVELGESDNLKVGQFVIAIGTALGEFRHTVTTGVISGLGRGIQASGQFGGIVEQLEDVIQTDAAINPGNSGGPLLNSLGQVIGINTAVSARGENIGFAIPINVLKASLDNFEATGRFDRAFLGVRYQHIAREQAILNDVPAGAYVHEVVSGSAADEAGLHRGDIITRMDGISLSDGTTLAEVINQKRIGQTISIEYWRDGETRTLSVELKGAGE